MKNPVPIINRKPSQSPMPMLNSFSIDSLYTHRFNLI